MQPPRGLSEIRLSTWSRPGLRTTCGRSSTCSSAMQILQSDLPLSRPAKACAPGSRTHRRHRSAGHVAWLQDPPARRRPARGALTVSFAHRRVARPRPADVRFALQHAIDYLDHAPAGFFSSMPATSSISTTLADWLDQDFDQVGSGDLAHRPDFGDGAALLTTLQDKTARWTKVLDLDLRTRDARCSAGSIASSPSAPMPALQPSRTLVLITPTTTTIRSAEPTSASSISTHTPMAIADHRQTRAASSADPQFAHLSTASRPRRGRGPLDPRHRRRARRGAGSRRARRSGPAKPISESMRCPWRPGERFGRFYVTASRPSADQERP